MFIITAKCSKRRVVKILLIFALLLSLFLALRACRHSSPPPVIAAGTNEERFDLTRYCGQTLSRYTYVVTNYPDASLPCQADLYVCDGALAAGDIVCTGENGFMAGLAFPAG